MLINHRYSITLPLKASFKKETPARAGDRGLEWETLHLRGSMKGFPGARVSIFANFLICSSRTGRIAKRLLLQYHLPNTAVGAGFERVEVNPARKPGSIERYTMHPCRLNPIDKRRHLLPKQVVDH